MSTWAKTSEGRAYPCPVESREGSFVPDAAEPLMGWRAWAMGLGADGEPQLRPIVYAGERWPAREVAEARCPPHAGLGHRSPDLRCTCGLYVVDGFDRLPAITGRDVTVIGTAQVWGRLVEHESGFRAEFGYPDRLRLVCGPCWESGAFGWPAVRVQPTTRGTLLALCARHARSAGEHEPVPVRLEQRLLSAYAVERLPDDAVTAIGAVWDRPVRRARTPLRSSFASAFMAVVFFGAFLGLVALAMSVR